MREGKEKDGEDVQSRTRCKFAVEFYSRMGYTVFERS